MTEQKLLGVLKFAEAILVKNPLNRQEANELLNHEYWLNQPLPSFPDV